jgi:pentatricopeptide repeat protein
MWRLQLFGYRAMARRTPLRKLTATDAAAAARRVSSTRAGSSNEQRFLSLYGQEATQTFPPKVQAWMNRKGPVELSTKAGAAKENLLNDREQGEHEQRQPCVDHGCLEPLFLIVYISIFARRLSIPALYDITRDDPHWLEAVVNEIKFQVPVGFMSEPIRNLCHTLMRWLRTQGDSAQIVEDLLLRLIEEEDIGGSRRVNSVLFSLAIDAWVKQATSRNAPQRAEALLQLMHDRHDENPSRPPPRASHVSQVLAAWSYSPLSHAPHRAEQLLKWMEDERDRFPASVYSYTSVIHAYAKHGQAEDAERVLCAMEARLKEDPKGAIRPNVITFTAVINAWANAGQGLRGAQMAESARKRLEDWHRTLKDDDLRVNVKLLSTLMHAWARSDSPDQGGNVERIWKELLDLRASLSETERNEPSNRLTAHPYNTLMEAWSRSGRPEMADKILNDMLDQVAKGDKNAVAPSNVSWTIVAHGWARQGDVKRTEGILKRMHEQYSAGDNSAKLNITVYNAILLAWNKQKATGAANSAQRLLDWMEEHSEKGMTDVHPNEISYGLVISAWSKSRKEMASKMVLQNLHRMENSLKRNRTGTVSVGLTYEVALATISKGAADNAHLEVLELLRHIEALHKDGSMGPILTNHCYHIAIASIAWSPARDGEELAEDILCRMEASPSSEFQPRTRSYDAAIIAWARSFKNEAPARASAILQRLEERGKEADKNYYPSTKTYNYILAACSASTSHEASEIALAVLEKMKEDNRKGYKGMRPSAGTFKLVFGDEFDKRETMTASAVEDMIQRMEDSDEHEDVDSSFRLGCYLYALTVWGWSVDPEAATHGERLWERMNRSTDISPNLKCFSALLRAYANNAEKINPGKADKMLRKLERDYSDGTLDWRPDSTCYDCLIDMWAKSKQTGAPQRAFDLLERMDTSYKTHGTDHIKPNRHTYASVLLACALTPAPDDGRKLHHFNIAVRAFNHLREHKYCEPDRSLYNRLLMCATYLAPDKTMQIKMTKHVFLLCCRDGHLDRRILKHYWDVAPKEDRRKLLGKDCDQVELSELPQEWSINAKEDRSNMI